jgi:EAL domain-containing protein (putative c-di-GMP-specific phosphodiesterase class I)
VSRETILIADDNESVTAALAMLLERKGRTTIVCADTESAELMLARAPITHVVTDVQFSGPFGYEGLHFLDRIRAKSPECRIALITGQPSDTLRTAAIEHGAVAMLAKPFTIADLEATLGTQTLHDDGDYEIIRVASLDEILTGDYLQTAFQPIVEMRAGVVEIVAFEALARIRGDWPAGGPAELFEYASRLGRLRELNLVSIARSLEAAATLPRSVSIFLNVDPLAFGPELAYVVEAAAAGAGIDLTRIVLEVTERSEFHETPRIVPLFHALRAKGIRFALDDHCSAYSHLALIDELRPSFVKISNTFGTNLEDDETHRRIVRHTVSLSHDFGCKTVLEGIESAETADAAARLGVDFAQGYHFGRPSPASHWQVEDRHSCLSGKDEGQTGLSVLHQETT